MFLPSHFFASLWSGKISDGRNAENLARPEAQPNSDDQERHHRARLGGALILHYSRPRTLGAATTELVSVER